MTTTRWLVDAVSISEVDGEIVIRATLLARDHEARYEAWWDRLHRLTVPTDLTFQQAPATQSDPIDPGVLGLEGLRLPALLGGDHTQRIRSTDWAAIPGATISRLNGRRLPSNLVEWAATAQVFGESVAQAVATLGAGNAALAVTAVATGSAGNAVTVTFVDPGAADQALAVTVSGDAISVSLATDANSVITTTAADLVTAWAAVSAVTAVATLVLAPGSDGSGLLAAAAATSLTGGGAMVGLIRLYNRTAGTARGGVATVSGTNRELVFVRRITLAAPTTDYELQGRLLAAGATPTAGLAVWGATLDVGD